MTTARRPVVGMTGWGDLFEDFHDTIGVSIDDFQRALTGGWLFGYVDALATAGVDSVLLFVSTRVPAPTRFIHSPTGAAVVILPAPRRHRLLRALRERLRGRPRGGRHKTLGSVASYLSVPVRAFLRELRDVDVLLSQDYEHARFDLFVLLGRIARRPVFASFQGGTAPFGRLEHLIRPVAVRACAGLVIGASVERERVRRVYRLRPDRIGAIPNALDVQAYRGADRSAARRELDIPDGTTVVGWHGRVAIRRKGLDVLLDAWERVLTARPDADLLLLLVGTGDDAQELHARIGASVTGSIRWRDEYVADRDELAPYLAAADIYVLPSRHEGFPVAPVEAMAGGLAVVACDAPGVSDILAGGEADGGIIVPREDADALAAALGRLIDDPELTRTLGRRARRRAETTYSLQAVGAELSARLLGGVDRI